MFSSYILLFLLYSLFILLQWPTISKYGFALWPTYDPYVYFWFCLCFNRVFYTDLSLESFNKPPAVLLNSSNEVLLSDTVFFNLKMMIFLWILILWWNSTVFHHFGHLFFQFLCILTIVLKSLDAYYSIYFFFYLHLLMLSVPLGYWLYFPVSFQVC